MAEPSPLFKVQAVEPDIPQQPKIESAAIQMIRMALSALWQRYVVALAQLFTLLSCGSVFVLTFYTADPNVHQLVMLGGYALFVLAANWLVIGAHK